MTSYRCPLLSSLHPVTFLLILFLSGADGKKVAVCERIIGVPMCEDSPYNMTRMPNRVGHTDQVQAAAVLADYKPLVEVEQKCSPLLKFFLCSVFTPMCAETVDEPVTSCDSVCETVKQSCLPVLAKFGLPWPEMLNCSNFPKKAKGELCMDPTPGKNAKDSATDVWGSVTSASRSSGSAGLAVYSNNGNSPSASPTYCFRDLITLESNDQHKICALSCQRGVMFQPSDKDFAKIWMALCSSLCFFVTLLILLTFWLDVSRFPYPVRPVIFMSACYNLHSVGHIVRLVLAADKVSCATEKTGCKYIIRGGLESSECVIVFLLLYYFYIASSIWWVVMTLSWYLASAKKWVAEALEKFSSFFHLAAWGIPAVLSIAVLITKRVDGHELTGLCGVGNQDSSALLGFVIVPLGVNLALGVTFIVLGFIAAVRIPTELKTQQLSINPGLATGVGLHTKNPRFKGFGSLEKLLVKLGIYSVLYIVPAVCVLGCFVYEKFLIDSWSDYTRSCETPGLVLKPANLPRVEIFMLKIFMSLVVGVTGGMWIWSRKTWTIWGSFLCRGVSQPTTKTADYQPGVQQEPTAPHSLHSGGSTYSRMYKLPAIYPSGSSEVSKV